MQPSQQNTVGSIRGSEPVVVIGAGPTGLSAAYHLGEKALLIEADDRVGGLCQSLTDGGFTFDHAGHIMFSNDAYVHEMYQFLLGNNVHWQGREAWVFSKGVYTRYPFQGSLYGLPTEVVKECLVGAIEARFRSLEPRSTTATLAKNLMELRGERTSIVMRTGLPKVPTNRVVNLRTRMNPLKSITHAISKSSSTEFGAKGSQNTLPYPTTKNFGPYRSKRWKQAGLVGGYHCPIWKK